MKNILMMISVLVLASCTSKVTSEERNPAQTSNVGTFKTESEPSKQIAGNCITVVPDELDAEAAIQLTGREYQLVYESKANEFTQTAAGFKLSYDQKDHKKFVYKLIKNGGSNVLFGITKPVKLKSSKFQEAFALFPQCPYVGGKMDQSKVSRTQLYSDMLASKFYNCEVKEDYWHTADLNCKNRLDPDEYDSRQMDCYGKCFYVQGILWGCYVEKMGHIDSHSIHDSTDIITESGKKYNKSLLNQVDLFVRTSQCKRTN